MTTMTDAELYLKYDYPETKEMGLQFLTLVTAVLAFSLGFAEKVFDFPHAAQSKRWFVIAGWVLYLLAITLCGLGLTVNSLAGGRAVYQGLGYRRLATVAYSFILFAGASFIIALLCTMIAATMVSTTVPNPH